MTWEIHTYPEIDQRVWTTMVSPSGPQLVVVPKPGFQRKYITFSTRYGSNDRQFVPRGSSDVYHVPAGIAHFLEHQLFDQPGRNVLEELSALGVSPNAYTGNYYTVYLVSAVENWLEAFDRLLDFVQSPAFTPEGVKKEQGVIQQEIHMYKDQPTVRVREDLLRIMYHAHPVRDTILGEVDDIMKIDREMLFTCHRTFYHPSNMTIMVTGDVDPDMVLSRAGGAIRSSVDPGTPIERRFPAEPASVVQGRFSRKMGVSRSYTSIGLKLDPLVDGDGNPIGTDAQTRAMAGQIALDALVGPTTPLYQQLYSDGVISDVFWYHFDVQPGVAYMEIGGQTDDPERFIAAIQNALQQVSRDGIDSETAERSRRAALGAILATMDSPSSINGAYLRDRYLGFDFFQQASIINNLALPAISNFFAEAYRDDRLAISLVQPLKEGLDA